MSLRPAGTTTIAIADRGMTTSGVGVLGRALVSIAPTHIVPALDRRKGDRAAALAQLVVPDVRATQARRGAAMDPHAAYADTARVLEEFLAG